MVYPLIKDQAVYSLTKVQVVIYLGSKPYDALIEAEKFYSDDITHHPLV